MRRRTGGESMVGALLPALDAVTPLLDCPAVGHYAAEEARTHRNRWERLQRLLADVGADESR